MDVKLMRISSIEKIMTKLSLLLRCITLITMAHGSSELPEFDNVIQTPSSLLSPGPSHITLASNIQTNPVIDHFDQYNVKVSKSFINNERCEEITIPMCRGIGYNFTAMPNELNHDSQEEAGLEVHQFWPLVEIRCSADLKFFLCSMYTPICLPEYTKPLPVCRSVCERARTGCAPLMQQYGFAWPERMTCEKLPSHGDPDNLCMEQNNHTSFASTEVFMPSLTPAIVAKPTKSTKNVSSSKCKPGKNQKCHESSRDVLKNCSCQCRPPLISVSSLKINNSIKTAEFFHKSLGVYEQYINVQGLSNCALPCQEALLTSEERNFATIWLLLWSGFCAISTLATIITFLIDPQRFKYPEKPIVFLSACYFFVSLGYLSRLIFSYEKIVCNGSMLKKGIEGPELCVTVFLLIYFFGMASSVWWVILSLTWFLAAGLKWGNEAISSYSQFFHLTAWIVPTIQTVWVLIKNGVAGDSIAGVCTVAPDHIQSFILAPLLLYLVVGTSFLFTGFVSLFRIRSVIKRQPGVKADKLEKLMIRIGIFSVLYTVPASAVLACHFYEITFRNDWLQSLACPCASRNKPIYSVLMLKYFMALAVGITSGVWIWSGKTLDSWQQLWRNLFNKKSEMIPSNTGIINTCTIENYASKSLKSRSLQHTSVLEVENSLLHQNAMTNSSHHVHHQVLKQLPLSHV
ncbi:hypothetical protein TKK_0009526 [Trichogramma kaykai]|uniref:Frizzled-5 n=1 Tax=Trichogramma kaykai TaxID=54128 RepID=A0ABD2WZN6_9HYME